jgi:hypothetical protein
VNDPQRLLDLTGPGEAPDFGPVLHASRLGSLPIAIELLKC